MKMKIATVERITTIRHHPNADRLDLISVLGYQCVTARDTFLPEQLVIFIQPDSVLPKDQFWSQSYLKYAYPRVRAIQIRNQWSEGLLIPLDDKSLNEGDDVAQRLGILHYEPIIIQDPTSIIGPLPFNIPKTDEERIENLNKNQIPFDELVDITQKIDGTSCSIYYSIENQQFGICGRNCEYDLTKTNNFTYILTKYNLKECLSKFCQQHQISLVLRGELYGGNIQNKVNNLYSSQALQWAMFSVYLMGEKKRYARRKMDGILYSIALAEHLHLPHVPILENQIRLTRKIIDRYSFDNDENLGEGVVIQHEHGSFKILNKNYDAKN